MVEVDIPQSFFEEQGRQLYGARLLEIQVSRIYFYCMCVCFVSMMCLHFAVNIFYLLVVMVVQANIKLNEQQLASLSSKKAVDEYLLNQKENITHMIKQSLAVGDIYKREHLQVIICP